MYKRGVKIVPVTQAPWKGGTGEPGSAVANQKCATHHSHGRLILTICTTKPTTKQRIKRNDTHKKEVEKINKGT